MEQKKIAGYFSNSLLSMNSSKFSINCKVFGIRVENNGIKKAQLKIPDDVEYEKALSPMDSVLKNRYPAVAINHNMKVLEIYHDFLLRPRYSFSSGL